MIAATLTEIRQQDEAGTLDAAAARAHVEALLAPLSRPELLAVCRELGVVVTGKGKADAVRKLVRHATAYTLARELIAY